MPRKILIVDDSATARALFKICLGDNPDYTLMATGDCNEAIKLAETEQPYLVVLDYNMPEMIGPEIAAAIRKKGVSCKFVLMSANTQQSVLDEVKELGFIDVLEKPITAEMVQSLLEKIS